jgi:hypothetical protein
MIQDPQRAIGRLGGWCVRANPAPSILFAAAVLTHYLWLMRQPSVSLVALESTYAFGQMALLLPAGRIFQRFLVRGYEIYYDIPAGLYRSNRQFWPWAVLFLGTAVGAKHYELPMQAGFLISRPAMDRLADAARADPTNAYLLKGSWAGVYQVVKVEVIGEAVVILTSQNRSDYGFIYAPGAHSDLIRSSSENGENDENSYKSFPKSEFGMDDDRYAKRIHGDWFVMYSAYWLIKDGWS